MEGIPAVVLVIILVQYKGDTIETWHFATTFQYLLMYDSSSCIWSYVALTICIWKVMAISRSGCAMFVDISSRSEQIQLVNDLHDKPRNASYSIS